MHHFMQTVSQTTIISSRRLATIILLCGLVGLFFIPHDFLFNSPTLCIHRQLLGFDCPGCGMTRALYSLLHLEFRTALHFNFAVFTLFPLLTTEIFLGLHNNKGLYKIRTGLYYILCLALITIYCFRIFNENIF